MKLPLTTLCYIESGGCYLMMHRVKKEKDDNQGKWIGVGGHFEPGESPEECLLREVKEETGLVPEKYSFRGIVTFVSDVWETDYMCLFTAEIPEMCLPVSCAEGVLEWIPKDEIDSLTLWEGDRIFLNLIREDRPFFSLKLRYKGEHLAEAVLNGKTIRNEEEN